MSFKRFRDALQQRLDSWHVLQLLLQIFFLELCYGRPHLNPTEYYIQHEEKKGERNEAGEDVFQCLVGEN